MVNLCVDFGGTTIKIGVVNAGVLLDRVELPNTSNAEDLAGVKLACHRLLEGHSLEAVGVAMPGLIAEGRVLLSTPGKYDYALGQDIAHWAEEAFGAPAVVENDARAALRGEMTFGVARGFGDVVLLILGTGIGTAAAIGGNPVVGRSGHAGILGGHVTVELSGPKCSCGNIGCAEAVANAEVLRRYADGYRGLVDGLPDARGQHVWDRSLQQRLWDRSIEAWGAAAAALCMAYDPSHLVLSGGVLAAAPFAVDEIQHALDRRLWPSQPRPTVLVSGDLLGSVLLGLDDLASKTV